MPVFAIENLLFLNRVLRNDLFNSLPIAIVMYLVQYLTYSLSLLCFASKRIQFCFNCSYRNAKMKLMFHLCFDVRSSLMCPIRRVFIALTIFENKIVKY